MNQIPKKLFSACSHRNVIEKRAVWPRKLSSDLINFLISNALKLFPTYKHRLSLMLAHDANDLRARNLNFLSTEFRTSLIRGSVWARKQMVLHYGPLFLIFEMALRTISFVHILAKLTCHVCLCAFYYQKYLIDSNLKTSLSIEVYSIYFMHVQCPIVRCDRKPQALALPLACFSIKRCLTRISRLMSWSQLSQAAADLIQLQCNFDYKTCLPFDIFIFTSTSEIQCIWAVQNYCVPLVWK